MVLCYIAQYVIARAQRSAEDKELPILTFTAPVSKPDGVSYGSERGAELITLGFVSCFVERVI